MLPSHSNHVDVGVLWKYRVDKTPMKVEELSHLAECDECLSVLALCQCCKTVGEVENNHKKAQT